MPLTIEQPKGLSPDQRGVFHRFSKIVNSRNADDMYDSLPQSKGGKIVSVDIARLLAPEWASWDGRIRHTESTGTPAGAYAHDRLCRELARTDRARRRLLITAGGAGSGKTSLLADGTDAVDLVFDNQLKNVVRARKIIQLALRHAWEIEIVFVHRPFGDVVRAVVERSQRTGR